MDIQKPHYAGLLDELEQFRNSFLPPVWSITILLLPFCNQFCSSGYFMGIFQSRVKFYLGAVVFVTFSLESFSFRWGGGPEKDRELFEGTLTLRRCSLLQPAGNSPIDGPGCSLALLVGLPQPIEYLFEWIVWQLNYSFAFRGKDEESGFTGPPF